MASSRFVLAEGTSQGVLPSLVQPGTVLLDTARSEVDNRHSYLFTAPVRVLTADTLEEVVPLLEAIDEAVEQGGYAAGYLAYEAGFAFEERAGAPAGDQPLAWFGVYEAPVVLDEQAVCRLLDEEESASFALTNARLAIDRDDYLEKIAVVKAHIHAGDVYQVNVTDRVNFDFEGSTQALYRALRRQQRVSYGAYVHTGETEILCCSPELFFKRADDHIAVRPMKGTAHRGLTLEEDQVQQRRLAADPKSRAENLMIVDLLRNDLSRCCRPGSVQVRDLFTTEVYEMLIQMTSTIEGRLREDISYADLFRALFPCGSVTGAPKIRAMQIIDDLEAGPRGVYCGGIGYVGPDQQAVFNVAIRTIVLRGGCGEMGTGSGIVWDSDPKAEYEECRLKAQFLTRVMGVSASEADYEIIETMRAEEGAIPLLELHTDRMRSSAQYFGFPFDETAWRQQVQNILREGWRDCLKVRVTLDRRGRFSFSVTSLTTEVSVYRRVMVAHRAIEFEDVFLYHKTTRRRGYEEAYCRAQADGCSEVLFLNERGEVTEGSRTNVFVKQGDALYTPPVACGLLGGVYRKHLLQTVPNASERVLSLNDLMNADAVYLCNAIHGLQLVEDVCMPVAPVDQPSA